MKILLTGGSGCIGRNFIEKYKDKYEIAAPDEEELNLANVRSAATYFKANKFDAVIHAEESEGGNTLVAFKNLEYFSVLHGIKKLIVIGDFSDLDRKRSLEGVTELELGRSIPKDAYGLSRYLITTLALKDKISTVLRFFNVYGKYADVGESKTMELIARGVTGKKTATIENDREYSAICVDDAVKVIAAFVDNDLPKGAYNVASDKPLKYTEVARTARRLAAKDFRSVDVEIISPEPAPSQTANVEKLLAVLPKLRFSTHSSAIKSTYEHLMKHKSQAKPRK